MSEKLKIISLGGLNEIGKNLTVYESGEDIIVVDCGMGFPDYDMYGVDVVIPDVSYLVKNQHRIRAFIITHGHEDHIGGIPYVFRQVSAPIYATALTAGLIDVKLAEHDMQQQVEIITVKAGDTVKIGCFKVEFIHVNHSIADAVALAIKTPAGMVIHTGDFKIDTTPLQGSMTDLTRFGELGNKGVLALLADSTNAGKPGFSPSEQKVGHSLDNLFKDCTQRIIVTTFASNVHRIQQVVNSAAKFGRKVGVTGRSMENILRVATELGYMDIPEGTLVDMNKIKNLPNDKVVIITTGSQGEEMSALYRMAFSGHRQIEIKPGDRVIISASAIPGNEKTVGKVINELMYKGAEVINDKLSDIHVSGHGCQEEIKMILALVKPKYYIPVHGEQMHLRYNAELAYQMGMKPKDVVISEIGKTIEISPRKIKLGDVVPSGRVLVDGTGVGDVGSVVLRDRKHLAQDGMLVVVVGVSSEDGGIVSGPDIITRGFIYVKESEDLINELKERTIDAVEECTRRNILDWTAVKGNIKAILSDYLYKQTKRNPMILPVIMEI